MKKNPFEADVHDDNYAVTNYLLPYFLGVITHDGVGNLLLGHIYICMKIQL